jgi:hypothetical protein
VVQNEVWKLELNFDENVKKPLVLIWFGAHLGTCLDKEREAR